MNTVRTRGARALHQNLPRPQPQAAPLSLPQRLSYLDAARQGGQITQAEYDQQRAAIIQSS
jgi:hypothetical protein